MRIPVPVVLMCLKTTHIIKSIRLGNLKRVIHMGDSTFTDGTRFGALLRLVRATLNVIGLAYLSGCPPQVSATYHNQ